MEPGDKEFPRDLDTIPVSERILSSTCRASPLRDKTRGSVDLHLVNVLFLPCCTHTCILISLNFLFSLFFFFQRPTDVFNSLFCFTILLHSFQIVTAMFPPYCPVSQNLLQFCFTPSKLCQRCSPLTVQFHRTYYNFASLLPNCDSDVPPYCPVSQNLSVSSSIQVQDIRVWSNSIFTSTYTCNCH